MGIRISTGMIYETGVSSMQKRTSSLLHIQQQVASGRRILSPSEDPVAAARALEVTQAREINSQHRVAQNNARSILGLEDAQLEATTNVIQRIRELTVQGGNGTLSDSDRVSMAAELRTRFDELMAIANSTDGAGQYLFSGFQGSTLPFSGNVDAGATYYGDDGSRTLRVSASRDMPVSDSGNDVFMRIKNGNGVFATGTRAAASTNTGTLVVESTAVTDPTLWASAGNPGSIEVRFWVNAGNTYYDLVDPANGKSLYTNNTSATPYTKIYTPGSAINFNGLNIPSGTATPYDDLGASITFSGAPATGDTFIVTATTDPTGNGRFTVLPKTAASANTGTAMVDRGSVRNQALWDMPDNKGKYEVRFYVDSQGLLGTAGETYYDIVDVTTNKSAFTGDASVRPDQAPLLPATWSFATGRKYSSGEAIAFSGMTTPYADVGISVIITGAPATGDAFTVEKSTSSGIFNTVSSLVASFETGSSTNGSGDTQTANDLSRLLKELDGALDNILRVRADVGTRLSEVDDLDGVSETLHIKYEETISTLQDIDYAKAITDLTRHQMELEAAQKSFMNISGLSLFNYL